MGKFMFVVSEEEVNQAMEKTKKELLDPHRMFGPWFNGDEKEFDEWAGDALSEIVLMMLEKIGVLVQ